MSFTRLDQLETHEICRLLRETHSALRSHPAGPLHEQLRTYADQLQAELDRRAGRGGMPRLVSRLAPILRGDE